jgi:hypothetical protein
MSVITVTQEKEIRKIMVGQIVCKTLSQKYLSQKKNAGGLAQGVVPDLKPQFCPPHQKENSLFSKMENRNGKQVLSRELIHVGG